MKPVITLDISPILEDNPCSITWDSISGDIKNPIIVIIRYVCLAHGLKKKSPMLVIAEAKRINIITTISVVSISST